MGKPDFIVIHHSLTPDGVLSDFEAIRRYHIEHNGWRDIGYHLVLEEVNGQLTTREGRPVGTIGAHCKEANMNSRGIGICVVGNFDLEPLPLARAYFLRDLCYSLMVNYQIPASNVIGHRDAGLMAGYDWRKGQFKTCPGRMFPLAGIKDILAGKIDHEWEGRK